MRYALLLNNTEPGEGEIPAEVIAEMQEAFGVYGTALAAAGVLVAGEILQPVAATTTVTRRDGSLQIQDGPFADTKEALAGVFVIDVPDLDAALAWAEKCPATQYGVIEVRPVGISLVDGHWV
ncbi:YciI family protein [Nocardia sp. 348MFTsu5.1]|uniref:YciI family protein n=1 Tax=Nocardia sp. 348MFTsu5.1 TaxID=1172185 RepID=UPI00037BACA9|nr:YciI family protein [Nocardia sp. 348MFTsu5.1]